MKILGSKSFLVTASLLGALFGSFLLANSLLAVGHATTAQGVDVFLLAPTPVSDTANVYVVFTNDGTPLNVMEAEIRFDPAVVSVTDMIFNSDLCEERFIIDQSIDNEAGRVHASCGTTIPFSGEIGIFVRLTLHAPVGTAAELQFGEATHVYVHDGKGTEIVRNTYNTTITL